MRFAFDSDHGAEDIGSGIGVKARMVDEYANSLKTPAPPAVRAPQPSAPAAMDRVNKAPGSNRYGRGGGEKRIDVTNMVKPLGSLKKGGKIKKTGIYKLHKNETVMPAKHAAKMGALAQALTKLQKQEAEEGE